MRHKLSGRLAKPVFMPLIGAFPLKLTPLVVVVYSCLYKNLIVDSENLVEIQDIRIVEWKIL
jgi:hypothetical protein